MSLPAAVQSTLYVGTLRSTQGFYSASTGGTALLNGLPSLLFFVLVLPAAWLFASGRAGLRAGLLICAAATFGSAVIRLLLALVYPAFWPLLLVQCVFGALTVPMQILPPVLAALWLAERERVLAVAVCHMTSLLGSLFSFFAAPAFIGEVERTEGDWRRHYSAVYGGMAAVALVSLVMTAVAVRDRPPLPPSLSSPAVKELVAQKRAEAARAAAGADGGAAAWASVSGLVVSDADASAVVRELSSSGVRQRRNGPVAAWQSATGASGGEKAGDDLPPPKADVCCCPGFSPPATQAHAWECGFWRGVLIALCGQGPALVLSYALMSLLGGIPAVAVTVLALLLAPYGASQQLVGACMGTGAVLGFISAVGFGVVVGRPQRYRVIFGVMHALSALILGGGAIAAWGLQDSPAAKYVVCFAVLVPAVVIILPGVPAAVEFGVEVSFPLPPVISGAIGAMISALLFAVGALAVGSFVGETPEKRHLWLFLGGSAALLVVQMVIGFFFLPEPLRRTQYEEEVGGAMECQEPVAV